MRGAFPPRSCWLLLIVLSVCLLAAAAFAADTQTVSVRVGTHPDFGRVVFDLPPKAAAGYHLTQDGDRVTIKFDNAASVASSPRGTRNILSITGSDGSAELVVAPGTSVREQHYGNHVVIDIVDAGVGGTNSFHPPAGPAAASPVVPPAAKPPLQATPSPPAPKPPSQATLPPPAPKPPLPQPAPSPSVAEPVPKPADVAPPPSAQVATEAAPATTTASLAPPDEVTQASTLVVPFSGSPLGAAAFRRGQTGLVVFDRPITLDLSGLHDDPVFSTATAQTLPAATVVLVRLEPSQSLSLKSGAGYWRISEVAAEPGLKPIGAAVADGRLVLSATAASAVVTVADPVTGETLLVGTQRHDGEGVPVRRHLVDFTLLPTWLGVVAAPANDRVALRSVQAGFLVSGNPGPLALSPPSEMADVLGHAAGLTRQFDFPEQPRAVALDRLSRAVAVDAMSPPLARGPRRQAVARVLLALGMGAEAEAMLQMAAQDDPAMADSPDNAALAGIAALLAHRPDEAGGLDDPRLPKTDDISVWRAYRRAAMQPGSPVAATELAAGLPLILSYPETIRDRILPNVAETLVEGGQTDVADALLKVRKNDASLDLARGMLREVKGDTAGALAIYDRLDQSRDQRLHARGAAKAVELRLASGAIDARKAADRLEKLLYAWRGDQIEQALRDRLAELRERLGEWRAALTLLRETEALFPDDKTRHAKLVDAFAKFLGGSGADSVSPLELVALIDENADLLPADGEGEALQSRLADRLLALDLPQRAGPLLEKLMNAAPTGAGRAGFGARLAALRQREGDTQGVLAALTASDAEDLPKELADRRTLLRAAAHARGGDTQRALSELESVNSAASDEARATILERANSWPAAQKALADYAAKTVPSDGALDDAQRRTMLRLATAAALAGDDAALAALREHDAVRMGNGPVADMFRLLTADPVRSVADLKRAGREAALARALPGDLKALQQQGVQTR